MKSRIAADVARVLAANHRPREELLDSAAGIVCEAMADVCVIGVLSDDGDSLHPLGVHHRDSERLSLVNEEVGLVWRVGVRAARVLATGEPHIEQSVDFGAPASAEPWWNVLVGTGPTALMFVVIRAADASIGVLGVARKLPGPAYTGEDALLLQDVAHVLGLALRDLRMGAGRDGRASDQDADRDLDPRLADLTARESALLKLLSEGLTNREIAGLLYLSVRTVEWYRARVLVKLDHPTRSELVALGRMLDNSSSRP